MSKAANATNSAEAGECPRARSDVLYRELADGGLIYDSTSKQVHHLNQTAALVWRGCQRGAEIGAMVEELMGSYSIDEQTVRADVEETLQRLSDGGLLVTPAAGEIQPS